MEWFTPPHVLECVRAYCLAVLGDATIPLDPASNPGNYTEATEWYDGSRVARDGLRQSWSAPLAFVNPPYGKWLARWCERIDTEARAGRQILSLLPGNRFETRYIQRHIFNGRIDAVCLVRKRLAFCDDQGRPLGRGNPYGSVIYLHNGDRYAFARTFKPLGKVLAMLEIGEGPE